MTRLPDEKTRLPKEKWQEFVGRYALLETKDNPSGGFARSTHLVCAITKYCTKTKKFLVQPFNQSGDKDGKPMEESRDDIYLFPPVGFEVPAKKTKTSDDATEEEIAKLSVKVYKIISYNLPTSDVNLVLADADPPEKKTAAKKKKKTKRKVCAFFERCILALLRFAHFFLFAALLRC